MLSTPTLHPFLSHFPTALLVAALLMLAFAKRRNDDRLTQAAALNLSLGLLAAVLAVLSGMFAADLGMWPIVDIEGHQGYSFAFVLLYVICTVYAYTNPFSKNALLFYAAGLGLMAATVGSGYLLVFQSVR